MKKLLEWGKKNPLLIVVIVLAAILLFMMDGKIEKTEKELTTVTSEKTTLQTKYDTMSTEYAEYKRNYNEDYEWVIEPVIGPDGKALLDGKGEAIYKKRLTKSKSSSDSGSHSGSSSGSGSSDMSHSASTTIIQKEIHYVGRQNRFVFNLGATTDALSPASVLKAKGLAGTQVRVFKGFGLSGNVTTPVPKFDAKETEFYVGTSFWW